jgi:hypothetical protein
VEGRGRETKKDEVLTAAEASMNRLVFGTAFSKASPTAAKGCDASAVRLTRDTVEKRQRDRETERLSGQRKAAKREMIGKRTECNLYV